MPTCTVTGGADPVSWIFNRPDGGRSLVWGVVFDGMRNVAAYRKYLLDWHRLDPASLDGRHGQCTAAAG